MVRSKFTPPKYAYSLDSNYSALRSWCMHLEVQQNYLGRNQAVCDCSQSLRLELAHNWHTRCSQLDQGLSSTDYFNLLSST